MLAPVPRFPTRQARSLPGELGAPNLRAPGCSSPPRHRHRPLPPARPLFPERPAGARRGVAALACALLAALSPASSLANGRFPAAGQIALHPADPASMVVRTTFGLLISRDGGAAFDWVCEGAVGLTADQDPQVGIFADGALALSPYEGLSLSHDGGCSFAFAAAQAKGESMIDLSVSRSEPSKAVAISWSPVTKVSVVYATSDSGLTWPKRGELPGLDMVPQTIDVAPGTTARVMASGTFSAMGKLRGAVCTSDDGGQSFTRVEIALEGETGVFLAAIDPNDPARVYARTSGGAGDRLLVSGDGGKSFVEAAKLQGAMLGFALSPDGAKVAIGGPSDGVLVADATTLPLSFSPAWPSPVSCLAWSGAGLYACGPAGSPFAVGRARGAGASFEPLLGALASIRGPLACPAGTPQATECVPAWPAQQKALPGLGQGGAGGGAGAAGQAAAGGAPGQAGSGGSLPGGSNGAGAGGATGNTTGAGAGTGGQPGAPIVAKGDSCAVSPGGAPAGWPRSGSLASLALLTAIAAAARRRSRRSACVAAVAAVASLVAACGAQPPLPDRGTEHCHDDDCHAHPEDNDRLISAPVASSSGSPRQ
jgi:hypothetical protein